jgi:hypothetical protein
LKLFLDILRNGQGIAKTAVIISHDSSGYQYQVGHKYSIVSEFNIVCN